MNLLKKIKIKIKYFELTKTHKNILRLIMYPLVTSQVILTTVNITELRIKNQLIENQTTQVYGVAQKLDTELKKLDKYIVIDNVVSTNQPLDLTSNITVLTNQIKQEISNEMKRNEKREKEKIINTIQYYYNELIHHKAAIASQTSGLIMLKILNHKGIDEITKRKFRLLYNKYDTSGYKFEYDLIKKECAWYDVSCGLIYKYMVKNINAEAQQIKKNDKLINSFKFNRSANIINNNQVTSQPTTEANHLQAVHPAASSIKK